MTKSTTLSINLRERFTGVLLECHEAYDEVTIVLVASDLKETCLALRDEPAFEFKQLMDVTVVDYLTYGKTDWETQSATSTGFDRAVNDLFDEKEGDRRIAPTKNAMSIEISSNPSSADVGAIRRSPSEKERFSVVYHLLSLTNNQRLRIKVNLRESDLVIPTVVNIWPSANWFEREAYDLFGVFFTGHPDLRRILTDYGFVGHPFRKDFPLSGYVEVRYDAAQGRVIYEPVDIEPRILVPKVIRNDERYNEQ